MEVVRRLASDELSPGELAELRGLFGAAWPDDLDAFTEADWDHAMGGIHFILRLGGEIVSHASVVGRELHVGEHRLRTGYVEAVATSPVVQGRGFGSAVMRDVAEHLDQIYQLGALGTGIPAFYERLGWVVWKGPTFVRRESALIRTPEEDGQVLVRLTPTSPELDLSASISCEWRRGDVW